ncbi:MAG: ribosomal protein L15 [uncultured bacterium]|nr:MAG: ribosomal protein L15 [uncultured bacterium]OGT37170.1 MAG: 50S ribosomal protein L15 [Gammaproteobacteria bacterium RIFCSPHIGHO2_12_FULL_38_14]
MYLNKISPAKGSKQNTKRLGRGIGSGMGKTAGRGHKGQRARAGGFHKIGFEGGQMPLQRRIPKFGFVSRKSLVRAEIRLAELNKIPDTISLVDLSALKSSGLINSSVKFVKVFSSGEIKKPIILRGIGVTGSAKTAILAAGGKVEE